jgi:hypothetical protein
LIFAARQQGQASDRFHNGLSVSIALSQQGEASDSYHYGANYHEKRIRRHPGLDLGREFRLRDVAAALAFETTESARKEHPHEPEIAPGVVSASLYRSVTAWAGICHGILLKSDPDYSPAS